MGQAQSPEWADEIKIRALTLIDNGVENENRGHHGSVVNLRAPGKPIEQVRMS